MSGQKVGGGIVASCLVILWFAIGGTRDLKDMIRRLSTMVRDHKDDGFVASSRKEMKQAESERAEVKP